MAFQFVIEKLGTSHKTSDFDCGVESMTSWIKRYALASRQSDVTQTYVLHQHDNQVIGYYALSAGDVNRETAPERIAKGMPNYPFGVIVLTRLAIDCDFKDAGLRLHCCRMHLPGSSERPRLSESVPFLFRPSTMRHVISISTRDLCPHRSSRFI